MDDKAIYTIYESEVVTIMQNLDIPINDEMKRVVIDHIQDYLNQSLDSEMASYVDYLKTGNLLEGAE